MAHWSQYNFFVPDQNEAILFSARTGALIRLSSERRSQIETQQLLDDDFYSFLASLGFIVEDGVDEVALVQQTHEEARVHSDSFSATIELTEACNFRCQYCYQPHVARHLDDAASQRIVLFLSRKMGEMHHVHVNWFGGEPLLRMKMLDLVARQLSERAKQTGCRFTQFLTTNGFLLGKEIAHSLASLGIQNVQITLDGDESSHNKLRTLASGRGTYHKVLEACVNVVQAGMELMVRININKFNAGRAASLLDDLLVAGVTPRNAVIHAVRTINHGNCGSSMADACYTNGEFARKWVEILREISVRGFGLPTLDPIAYNCPFDLQQTVMIGHDGTIRHCSSSEGRLAELDEYGNERGRTPLFEKIKQRRPTDDHHCASCKYLPMCMGGCSYLREIGQEPCNPEKYVLGEMIALSARQGLSRNSLQKEVEHG